MHGLQFGAKCANVELHIDDEEKQVTQQDQALDRIERSIGIEATEQRVWDLVSRPGWWINEGSIDSDPQVRREGDVTVVTHPRYGEFRLETVTSEPPRYVAFRWVDPGEEEGTLVEFWIDPREHGVTLTVAESGFAGLGKDRQATLRQIEENTAGWEAELAAARRYVTGARA